jgi:cyclophilin family peptidyl-prolyl cis-trans isomerase
MEISTQTPIRFSQTKEYFKQYVQTHQEYREKNLERSRDRYYSQKADPEKYKAMREYQKKYREENAERIREKMKEYRQKKKE